MTLIFNLPIKHYLELKLTKELGGKILYKLSDEYIEGIAIFSPYEIINYLNDNKIIDNDIIVTPVKNVNTTTKVFDSVRFSPDVKIVHNFDNSEEYKYSIIGTDDIVIDISKNENIVGFEILEQTAYNIIEKCNDVKVAIIYDKNSQKFVAKIFCDSLELIMGWAKW